MSKRIEWSPEIAAELCSRMAEGKSLRTVCAEDGMPSRASVFTWLAQHEEFRVMYEHANDAMCDAYAEETVSIADEQVGDMPQASRQRERIKARQWYVSKIRAKKYGERQTIGLGAAEELPPLVLNTPESRLELARRVAFLLTLGDEAVTELTQRSAGTLRLPAPDAPVDAEFKERPRPTPWPPRGSAAQDKVAADPVAYLHEVAERERQERDEGGGLDEQGLQSRQPQVVRSMNPLSARRQVQ